MLLKEIVQFFSWQMYIYTYLMLPINFTHTRFNEKFMFEISICIDISGKEPKNMFLKSLFLLTT